MGDRQAETVGDRQTAGGVFVAASLTLQVDASMTLEVGMLPSKKGPTVSCSRAAEGKTTTIDVVGGQRGGGGLLG